MFVSFDLFDIGKPIFGRIVFPKLVVETAIVKARGARLEICRYEVVAEDPLYQPDYQPDEMISRLSESGKMLEVIGHVHTLEIVDKTLKATGYIDDAAKWHLPYDKHVAVPYMEMRSKSEGDHRIVIDFTFTEIVLVYQAVTLLALRKYVERKSFLGIDKSPVRE